MMIKNVRSAALLVLCLVLSQQTMEWGFIGTASTAITPEITKKVKKSTNTDTDDIVSQIKGLKELLDAGAITQDEFDKAKKKLLN